MSVDFQVVFPTETVQLGPIRRVPGSDPPVLDITGEDFRSVDEVLINNIPSPEVIVLSQFRLLARVPDQFKDNASLSDVSVVSRNLTITAKSLMKFMLGQQTCKVSGLLRLVQLFLKILFTTPGTDIFAPNTGGAGLTFLGKNFSSSATADMVRSFVLAVDRTAKQIVAIQSRNPSIPQQERLLAAKVLSAKLHQNETALVVSVELTSQAGQAAVSNVML